MILNLFWPNSLALAKNTRKENGVCCISSTRQIPHCPGGIPSTRQIPHCPGGIPSTRREIQCQWENLSLPPPLPHNQFPLLFLSFPSFLLKKTFLNSEWSKNGSIVAMVVISIIFVVQTLVFWIFLESDRTPSKSQDPFSHPELWSLLAMKIRLDDLEDIYAFPVFLSCFFLVVVEKWPSIWRAVGVFLDFGGVVGVVCWVNLMFMCLRTTVLGHIVIMRVYFEFPDTLLALILGPTGHKFVAECSWLVPYALVFFCMCRVSRDANFWMAKCPWIWRNTIILNDIQICKKSAHCHHPSLFQQN